MTDIRTDKPKFWNRVTAALVFIVSAVTYLSTIEPSAPYWDCGEFTASSYKLEVGHPPGNPFFQLIVRLFTIFGDNMHAAVLANACSAVASALTILLLYLTVVFFAKRLVPSGPDGKRSPAQWAAIFGSGAAGALAYCFSDTFWFSAVESEVYGMSSLFTALVIWCMTKWYDEADNRYANRWIVLIALLMGLSIGVHMLNLLAIPAIVFMFYYKKREDGKYTFWEYVKILLLSAVIVGLMVFIVVPYLPKLAAYTDLFFVNVLGLPYNTGAAFFLLALLALCFWGLFRTLKQNRVFWNTALLCATMVVVGFSVFSIEIIRSSVKTPTNEYQPDNAFTLVRYISREQYGSQPLLYGPYFDAPYDLKSPKYWAPIDGKYKKVDGPVDAVYDSSGEMFFPRMWNNVDPRYVDFYESYMEGKGKAVPGAEHKKPTFGANMRFFFDFQLGWMYWRYFMWNFVGRQNEIHGPSPNLFYGNWESGVKLIDDIRLGDQSFAPDILSHNKGKNHYYFLPLLLGLLGLFFQFDRDKRGCWLVFLTFFMTGIAIVIYLNQPPFQVRERDYAYAGSFYAFTIWIGLGVAALYSWISDAVKGRHACAVAAVAVIAGLVPPAIMAKENWDDHDRSHRSTAVEMARNYLNSVGPQGILVTHGDNDTFPLWYAQEVENVRTDVRIVNTSLLGTDWHIDQMKYAVNESKPLPLTIPATQYLYGTNEMVYLVDRYDKPLPLSDVMGIFRHPDAKVELASGRKVDYIVGHKFTIPVNKENVLKYGILSEKFADRIPEEITIEIPASRDFITKPELFLLDLLSNYQWDRPLNFLNMGGDLNVGIKDYLMYDGYSYRFTPLRNKITSSDIGLCDTDDLYRKMTEVYTFDSISRTDWLVDYQNMYTHLASNPLRSMFESCAHAFIKAGEDDRALEMLDKCQEVVKDENFPLEAECIGFGYNDLYVTQIISDYYYLGQTEKARDLAIRFYNELVVSIAFFMEYYEFGKEEFETCCSMVYYLSDAVREGGDTELADKIISTVKKLVGQEDAQAADSSENEG